MPALRDDPKKLVYTQHNLANVYRAMGDLDRALECLVESDEIARVHLLPIQRSFHLTSIAHIQLQQGHIDAALETYRAAVDLSRRARHADGLVQSLRMLGNALLGLARYEEALPCLAGSGAAVRATRRPGVGSRDADRRRPDPRTHVAARSRAGVERRAGAAAPARRLAEASWRRAKASRERCAPTGARTTPIPAFESALALAATIGERAREAAIRNVLGILEWERGGYAEALRHYESALALIRDRGRPPHRKR